MFPMDDDFCPFKMDFDSTTVGSFSLENKPHPGISQIDRWDWEDKMENYDVDTSLHTVDVV